MHCGRKCPRFFSSNQVTTLESQTIHWISICSRTDTNITVVIFCWHILLISESMDHHDSEIMDDRSID